MLFRSNLIRSLIKFFKNFPLRREHLKEAYIDFLFNLEKEKQRNRQ